LREENGPQDSIPNGGNEVRVSKSETSASPTSLRISVIVATFNRAESILRTLEALSVQTLSWKEYEIIVVDDGSTDLTEKVVKEFIKQNDRLNVSYWRHEKNKGKAAACNTGIERSRGNWIAFTDDDIRPVENWLAAHLSRHQKDGQVQAVTGLVLYPDEWANKSNWIRYANSNYRKNERYGESEDQNLPPNRFAGGNISLPRDELVQAGMFSDKVVRSEDVELGCRLFLMGIPLKFERNAVVFHYADAIRSIEATLRSFRRSFENDRAYINEKYPWYYQKYGHWFLEPLDRRFDGIGRICIKLAARGLARKRGQRLVIKILKKRDNRRNFHFRFLYQYVMACEAMDAVRSTRRGGTNDRTGIQRIRNT
jgi:glycosyltransferase involved in cell wall biosynthesis